MNLRQAQNEIISLKRRLADVECALLISKGFREQAEGEVLRLKELVAKYEKLFDQLRHPLHMLN